MKNYEKQKELAFDLIMKIKVTHNLKDIRDVPDFVDNLVNEVESLKWSLHEASTMREE